MHASHSCGWMGCTETFSEASILRSHLLRVHFEEGTFYEQCRVPGGRWEDWKSIHGSEHLQRINSFLATPESNHPQLEGLCPPSPPRSSRLATPDHDRDSQPSRSPTPLDEHRVSPLSTPGRSKSPPSQRCSFTGLSSPGTPFKDAVSTHPVEPSPSLSMLVRRKGLQALSMSPALGEDGSRDTSPMRQQLQSSHRMRRRRASSSSDSDLGSDGPVRKRPRLLSPQDLDKVDSEDSQDANESNQFAISPVKVDSDTPLQTFEDSYPQFLPSQDEGPAEADSSFPEFLPSDDEDEQLPRSTQGSPTHSGDHVLTPTVEQSSGTAKGSIQLDALIDIPRQSSPLPDIQVRDSSQDEAMSPARREDTVPDAPQADLQQVLVSLSPAATPEPSQPPRRSSRLRSTTPATQPAHDQIASGSNIVQPDKPASRRSSRLRSTTPAPIASAGHQEDLQTSAKQDGTSRRTRSRSRSRPLGTPVPLWHDTRKRIAASPVIEDISEHDDSDDRASPDAVTRNSPDLDSLSKDERPGVPSAAEENARATDSFEAASLSAVPAASTQQIQPRWKSGTLYRRRSQASTAKPQTAEQVIANGATDAPPLISYEDPSQDDFSQIPLMTQAPYHFASQDSATSP